MFIKDFISKKWLPYADYDNRRSLPHIMDGLKITQRKVIHTALGLPKGDKPIRVSQFASKAAEVTAYHHGEASMLDTVVKMAQDYPGSNNYPLLEKHGQFGSRLSNESAAPRYIHTKLHKDFERFFKKEDLDIVEYLYDDEDKIEPKYFIPVIPTLLLNGANGVGNGYKSLILNYEIADVVKAVKEWMKHGKVKTPLIPNIRGFTGTVEKVDRQVIFKGVLKVVHTTKLHITELPPGYDNDSYKELLNKLIDAEVIKDYDNNSTEEKWDWVIDVPRTTSALGHDKLIEKLGLITKVTENFVGWGMDDSAPMVFDGPEALVEYWCEERLKLYAKSLKHQIKVAKTVIKKLDVKIRFVKWCLKNDFRKLSKAEFIAKSVAGVERLTEEVASDLVSMPMYRITTDEVAKLELEMDNNIDILDTLESLTPEVVMERGLKGL